jgi:hypothetical protein
MVESPCALQGNGTNMRQTLCSILKWCWSRLPGGVVTWDVYELFRIGEAGKSSAQENSLLDELTIPDSNLARHAFDTFIPLSVDSEARKHIIFDFFDLLSAVAARGKTNGMGGRKLSRLAGWWAFEFVEDGKGFDGGYRTWEKAADAASHLFFAYLRSLTPENNAVGSISNLPRSLQSLLAQTEYPPQTPTLMQTHTTKVVMIVDSVSPTPFSLLRRAKHFEYRDDDAALQQFSAYEDTVRALTDECRRVGLHAGRGHHTRPVLVAFRRFWFLWTTGQLCEQHEWIVLGRRHAGIFQYAKRSTLENHRFWSTNHSLLGGLFVFWICRREQPYFAQHPVATDSETPAAWRGCSRTQLPVPRAKRARD